MKTKNTIINRTKDLFKFEKHPSNPETRKADKALIESMRRYGWIDAFPMLVVPGGNGKFLIIEGHRRLDAATQLSTQDSIQVEAKYVIDGNDDIDPRYVSSRVRAWNQTDYVNSYAQTGKQHYCKLLEFAGAHGLSLTTAAFVLSGKQCLPDVIDGSFAITNTRNAPGILKVMRAIRGENAIPRVKWWSHQRVVIALAYIMRYVPSFSCDTMAKKIQAHAAFLSNQPNVKGFIEMLEQIYNRHNRESLQISAAVDQGMRSNRKATAAKMGKANATSAKHSH
jgi:hypothetical protein